LALRRLLSCRRPSPLGSFAADPLDFAEGKKVALADYHAAKPTGVPASLAQASLVERGAYLARAADCLVCHTAEGARRMRAVSDSSCRSGRSIRPTSRPTRRRGNYSNQDFLNAVNRGIRRDGARLYPAMPYTSYTYITDADALAIKAYLFSLLPVNRPAPANTLSFPFNQRWGMIFWSALFNPDTRFMPDSAKSPEWNRGAYLAEAAAHCGECHTPRNLAFALNNRRKYAGAVTAGWHAYNITSDKATGIGAWSDDDIATYLSNGHANGHGTASGPMGEAVDRSFSTSVPEDIRAMVAYLRSVPPVTSPDLPATLAPAAAATLRKQAVE
jgi:mono/diheme cytochrome c family protein